MSQFQFYSEADTDKATGRAKSEYPLWYNPRQISEMEDDLAIKRAAIESGAVPRGYEAEYREGISRLEKQLAVMKDMTLVDDASNDKDVIDKITKELGKVLKAEYPSQTECDRRTVDVQRENWKRFNPYLNIKAIEKLSPDDVVAFAHACEVPISPDGKLTRDGMEKMWKIGRKYMGENANTEILRRS